jgi:hypothetical protein
MSIGEPLSLAGNGEGAAGQEGALRTYGQPLWRASGDGNPPQRKAGTAIRPEDQAAPIRSPGQVVDPGIL